MQNLLSTIGHIHVHATWYNGNFIEAKTVMQNQCLKVDYTG